MKLIKMDRKFISRGYRKMHQAKKGQEIVEFAIAFPLFAIIAFGTMEVSFLLYQQGVLNYAARETARFASMDTSGTKLVPNSFTLYDSTKQKAIDIVRQFSGQTVTTVTVDSWFSDRTFSLTATQSYHPAFGKLIPIISNIQQLKATITMYCEACG